MADTVSSSISTDTAAYDRLAYLALRPELYFDRCADVKPTRQTHPGSSVKFEIVDDLAVASTALNESADVTPVALSDSQVTVTLVEHGNAVQTWAKVRGTSYIPVNEVVANVVGYNAGVSLDTVARDKFSGGSNVTYATGQTVGRAAVESNHLITVADIRKILAQLRAANVPTFGGLYCAFIHPDVAYDLRGDTSTTNTWRTPHEYSKPDDIWNGEVGTFEGFRFIETPRARIFADAGSSTTLTDVYATVFCGRQSLAKAHSYIDGNGPFPKVVMGPVTDILRRRVPFGWYWLGGYSVFRQASLRRFESASSIGANTVAGSNN